MNTTRKPLNQSSIEPQEDAHRSPFGALQGLRVLDLSRVLAGPYCTMILGDYGADVIKVEAPGRGDDTRGWGPPWAGEESAYFLAINRNKRSLSVNLKHPEGLSIVQKLAQKSDVLIENFKVGTAARFNLDYQTLRPINPGLIYCSITGYGQTGPHKHKPGYDFIIQAEGGLMSISGPPKGPPSKVGVAIVDITTGLFAANAILAALHQRNRSGQGDYIDIALLDSQIAWLANVGQNYLVTEEPPTRYGNAHPNIVPYEVFPTSDGYIALGIGNDTQFKRFCDAISRASLSEEERYRTNAGRVRHRETLVPILQQEFLTHTTEHWLTLCERIGIPAAPINSIPKAFNHAQVQAREMIQTVEHPTIGPLKIVGPVAKHANFSPSIQRPPPSLGQHTDEVLQEELGYEKNQIEKMRGAGTIQ